MKTRRVYELSGQPSLYTLFLLVFSSTTKLSTVARFHALLAPLLFVWLLYSATQKVAGIMLNPPKILKFLVSVRQRFFSRLYLE